MSGHSKKSEKFSHTDFKKSVILIAVSVLLFAIVIMPGESGNIWNFFHCGFWGIFGALSWAFPFTVLYSVFSRFIYKKIDSKFGFLKAFLILNVFCGILHIFFSASALQKNFSLAMEMSYSNGILGSGGGVLGFFIGSPFIYMFGVLGSRIIFAIVICAILLILTVKNPDQFTESLIRPIRNVQNFFKKVFKNFFDKENLVKISKQIADVDDKTVDINNSSAEMVDDISCASDALDDDFQTSDDFDNKNLNTFEQFNNNKNSKKTYDDADNEENTSEFFEEETSAQNENYSFPPISFLNKSENLNSSNDKAELEENGRILVESLKNFNIDSKIIATSRGPTVTRFELQPSAGVKISKITNLSDDIALNLAALGIRFEAPIPGKSAIGVEIPNKVLSIVNMRELIASPVFKASHSKLSVVLGRDISGKIVVADLAKMPHLLIAGSTGSGKSVCINSFIISLLYKARPDEVKFLMIDPKVVELGIYNGIPHLLAPVVTDPKKAAKALKWAVEKMLKRYKIFAQNNVRDINSYNQFVIKNRGINQENGEILQKLEKIVIIIDELSDLMMAAPKEVEGYICRLAQMARAAGIHLVIATQRPSVDVITGIIKANIPSRIALAVSSQVDSRTILDMCGAEKLIGRGDMLFSPIGSSKPIRVQGCFVTDEEVENIVSFVKKNYEIEKEAKVGE